MEGYKYGATNPNRPNQIVPLIPENQVQEPFEDEGMIPRAIRDLFRQIHLKKENDPSSKITVSCSYIQLYNDLLNSDLYKS
jgi:hypothetical protein